MNESPGFRVLVLAFGAVILAQAGCLLAPNDKETAARAPNLPPSVHITGGTVTLGPAGATPQADFSWNGSDADGVIASYQWAVDDTASAGAWHDTPGSTARLAFTAARQATGSDPIADGWHTFFVRAVDNRYSFSRPDLCHFNTRTIAPTSRITFPVMASQGSLAWLPSPVVVRWEGEDLDSSLPDGKPLAYEYKLVQATLAPDSVYVDSLRNGQNLLDSLGTGPRSRWIRVPRTTTQVTLRDLPPNGWFVFGVRAVDEAGAIEPSLDNRRNFLAFSVGDGQGCRPTVEVRETSLGTYLFVRDRDTWEIVVPADAPLRFCWQGDASDYGSKPGRVNYALDIPDPEDDSLRDPHGIGGWIGWGYWRSTRSPLTFPASQGGTIHNLYVLMRDLTDSPSSTRRCVIKMTVVPFTFSKIALVVDDARFPGGLPDSQHDDFLNRTILRRLRELGEVDDFAVWPTFGEEGFVPAVPQLGEVTDYQAIVWSLSPGSNLGTGFGDPKNQALLSTFLKAGGRLFLFGAPIVGANVGSLAYPRDPPTTDRGKSELYFRFLYMQNEIVSGMITTGETCFAAKSGLLAARAANPAYPDLFLDPAKWDPWRVADGEYVGGIFWEGNMSVAGQSTARYEGLDTLYTVETWNRSIRAHCGTDPSSVESAIISARYQSTKADTVEGRQHGRVVWIDFQPWWFQGDRLMDAGTAAVTWLFTGRDQ